MEQQLSYYKIFYEVAKYGNISKAAKTLFISQPAISKSLRRLEEELGATLFLRNSRGVSLTAEGQILFTHVQAGFDAIERGEEELRQITQYHYGQIRIGVSNTLCKYILLPYLKEFIKRYPKMKVTIESQSTTHTLEMLSLHHLDIGLIAKTDADKALDFFPVREIQDTFVAADTYLEALHMDISDSRAVLEQGNVMLMDRSNVSRLYIEDYLEAHDININQLLEVTTMDLLIEFAKIGLGIGCVIREFVQKELDDGSLREIFPAHPIARRTIGFACHAKAPSFALSTFLDFIENFPK